MIISFILEIILKSYTLNNFFITPLFVFITLLNKKRSTKEIIFYSLIYDLISSKILIHTFINLILYQIYKGKLNLKKVIILILLNKAIYSLFLIFLGYTNINIITFITILPINIIYYLIIKKNKITYN